MRIDSYPVTSTAPGVSINTPASGMIYKKARMVILKNTSGTVTLGGVERGSYPLPANVEVKLEEVNRAGQSGKYELSQLILRGVGVTEVILVDPSME